MHHHTAVLLHVVPELFGQEFDVHDGRQQQEELAQPAGVGAVVGLDALRQGVLELVL